MAQAESMKYQDRIAVVTGAGSGIGRALTCALTRDGAHVAASGVERHPVTVHCVHPGVVRTNFGTNMRTAESEDPDLAAKLFARAALTSPDKAARIILRGAEKNRARILIGPDGRAMAAMPRVLGAGYVGLLARAARLTSSAR